MTDEDLASVVVFLRSLKPIRHPLPKTSFAFPVQYLVRLMPLPVTSPVTADQSTSEKRGQYLVTIAACAECHSSHDPPSSSGRYGFCGRRCRAGWFVSCYRREYHSG